MICILPKRPLTRCGKSSRNLEPSISGDRPPVINYRLNLSLIVYTPVITARIAYVVDFIGMELFGEPLEIIANADDFRALSQPKLNYSQDRLSDQEFFLAAHPLLSESGIRIQELDCFEVQGNKAFFRSSGDFPFDLFAASFYLMSRYEEYLPYLPDAYGRFPASSSLAYQQDFLRIPLINCWIETFRNSLKRRYPGLVFRRRSFKFIPTYDIDMAYAYLHKGWMRAAGGLLRSLAGADKSSRTTQGNDRRGSGSGSFPFLNRIRVLTGKKKDPFDSYEWLDSLHLYCRTRAYYFFLVARLQKKYDRNISPSKEGLQDLIQYHAAGYTVGIHPSWQSGDDEKLLREELEWLEYIANRPIRYSRQHYIRLRLPETYRRLLAAGIDKDFSMGYGSVNGFRASVASSFAWYDLEREERTGLVLFPFCFMDSTTYYELKYSAQQAFSELMHFYHCIRKINGLMITIWHNHFLGSDPLFAGWREVYEVFLKEEVYWDI